MKVDSWEEKILEVLLKNPQGLTTESIGETVGISRQTAAKYLGILEAKKMVVKRVIGPASLYYHKDNSKGVK